MAFDITKPAGNDSVGSSAALIRENFRALLQDKFTQGSTTPSSATGIDGYLFFNTTEKILYEKISGVWTAIVAVDVPDATASTKGKMKLYTSTGNSTDGTMTRQAITTALSGKLDTNGKAALSAKLEGIYTSSGGQQPPSYFGTNAVGCLMSDKAINGDSSYKNWIYADSYHGSDAGGATAIGVSRDTARAFIMQSDANRNTWNNTAELAAIAAQGTDYIKFSNGFIIQWGIVDKGSTNFHIAFNSSAYVAVSEKGTGSIGGALNCATSTTTITIRSSYGGNDISFFYIAVGF